MVLQPVQYRREHRDGPGHDGDLGLMCATAEKKVCQTEQTVLLLIERFSKGFFAEYK